jgi:molybdopterin converting factor small subunit
MRVTVLLFASYADALGERSLTLDLPTGARAAAVLDALSAARALADCRRRRS